MPLLPVCRPCLDLDCINPDDFSAGIDSAIYSALDYSFIVNCPEGCYCPPGLFPQTISILASTIPPVIPPTTEPGFPIELRLQGCLSTITRTLSSTATLDDIRSAAQSMQAEWAGQQAQCIAQSTPGVNCNVGSTISVCNDAQIICCPGFGQVFVPANTFCSDLNITGLTQGQIDAATAALKDSLNANARNVFCPLWGFACAITEINLAPPGGAVINLVGHNLSATVPFDSSTFAVRDNNGTFFFSLQPTIPPLTTLVLQGPAGPFTNQAFSIWYKGVKIFTDPNPASGHDRQVDVFVGCGPPPPPPCT